MTNETTAHITPQTTRLSPTLKAWEVYLKDQGSSPHTVVAFLGDLRLLVSYLPPDKKLGDISLLDLNNFLDWMQNKRDVPCSPKTLARRITSLKSFFRWLHEGGALPTNPAERVVQKSVKSPLPEVLTPEEVERILKTGYAYLESGKGKPRAYILFALLLHTGIKKGECVSLGPNHVHLEAPQVKGRSFLFVMLAPKTATKSVKSPCQNVG